MRLYKVRVRVHHGVGMREYNIMAENELQARVIVHNHLSLDREDFKILSIKLSVPKVAQDSN